ncbi:SGNH/GDSL hydrolase family protein [Actinophytocola sediminis]
MKLSGLGAVIMVGLGVMAPPAAAAAPAPAPVEWVAVGDSYTAGGFVGTPEPSLDSADRDGCDRTAGAYPALVAGRLAGQVSLTNVSCGNATVTDIAETRQTPVSPVRPPSEGWQPVGTQLARAGVSDQTEVITIGVGGNSMPLGTMMLNCLLYGTGQDDDQTPCRDAYENGGSILDREAIRDKFHRVFREYLQMLEQVREQAPTAKVITVGYPTIFPEDAANCVRSDTTQFAARVEGADTTLSMTHGDIQWLHGVVNELNAIFEDATDLVDYGYTYVDASSQGHDVCQPVGTRWVEGVCGSAQDYWPATVTLVGVTLTCSDGTRATLVHPNADGQLNTATKVETAVRAVLQTP